MNKTCRIVNLQEEYSQLYKENLSLLENGAPEKMNASRAKAFDLFVEKGIPSNKVEEYKYTNLQPFFKGSFDIALSSDAALEGAAENFNCGVPELDTHNVFLINGWFANQDDCNQLPKGVVVGSIREKAEQYPEVFEKYYNENTPNNLDAMAAMNTAFAQDGAFIYVPKGVVVEKPIQLVNIMSGDNDRLVFQRNLIVVEENAQVKVMLCDHTISPQKFVINNLTEVFVKENSVFDIYNVQNQHNLTTQVSGMYVHQKKHSNILTNNLTLHSGVTRNNIRVTMDDEHCESHVYGLYLSDKNQHVDNFTFIDHAKPNCQSFELFKGVMDDSASGAFTGRVLVRPDAQQTNAYQSNNNLLLTDNAKINSKPQLEIYADDVKCSHGATVGQLDDEAMFYLRARGINQTEGRILLMFAFAYEVIEKIRVEPLKENIRSLVEKRFRGEFDKCDSCVVCGQQGSSVSCL
ncbi:Fe-S cluster assembly protein SufD [Carboxylicivirga sp. M1479]|uniref:Fe-S cluster assembly protein SufD n=1 Tax=Carboxylicivirga sp. M1479 TaxID=2594476 RepID=UPI0011773EF2|nr:Fe-S cluster assembly protein SufD [Carboxylicivirga sp. M1479]TRX64568.1 Fe-S cluster assembly protein SufD [Carboxylicivirga sp. M1479]